jgi:gamma-glutamylaminecyclotransferase
MNKVFVFGTLKEGFPNFKKNKGIRFRGEFETKERYPLYLVGQRRSPWLVLDKGNGYNIQGQVFNVTDDALTEMDKLERISEPDGYCRNKITVLAKDSGEEFLVSIYAKQLDQINVEDVRIELPGEYSIEHAAHYRSRNA